MPERVDPATLRYNQGLAVPISWWQTGLKMHVGYLFRGSFRDKSTHTSMVKALDRLLHVDDWLACRHNDASWTWAAFAALPG